METDLPIRPALTPEEAVELAAHRFGVTAGSATPLPSDRDQNFLLEDDGPGRRYVLKLAHSKERKTDLDFQNRMLEHLGRAGFPLQKVIRSREGNEIEEVAGPEDASFLCRLLTWLPGDLLHQVNPQTPGLFRSLGAFLGGMDLALADMRHPAQDRALKWDLRHASRVVRTHLLYVEDPDRLALVEGITDELVKRLRPLERHLRLGIIHGDANDHNILVGPPDHRAPGERRVTGVLDFGDSVRSYLCGDPAVAGAYAMLGKADPLTTAAEIVRGYHQVLPLSEPEVAALFPLMGLRLCASVAISAFQRRREPGNDYLSVSEEPAWDLLEYFATTSLDFPYPLFRHACDLAPVPGSRAVNSWVEEQADQAAPVLRRRDDGTPLDLSTIPLHVFDLSVETGEFGATPPPEDAASWADILFGKLEDAGAEVGIGRYEERRRLYATPVFAPKEGTEGEWRTVHLGVDLFVEPGTTVCSPLDAVVHSFADNGQELDYGPTVVLEHRAQDPQVRAEAPFYTLYGHLAEDALASLSPGQRIRKGEAFARVGTFPQNGNWAPHLHFQIMTNLLGMRGNFPGVCRPSQLPVWKALLPDPTAVLRIPPTDGGEDRARPGSPSGAPLRPRLGRTKEELLKVRRSRLGPNLSVSYEEPLKIVHGHGQFLYDQDGQPYLDCVNNVPHVGHGHPRVVAAGQRQMAVLNTNTRYLHDGIIEYAERLLARFPEPLSVIYFVCSGSEANELALRMARTHTGLEDVIVVDGAYHGNTSAMVDLSPYKFDGPGGVGAKPWVHKTTMPDPYRGRFRSGEPPSINGEATFEHKAEYLPEEELGPRYAEDVGQVIVRLQKERQGPAAFFCESFLGCGGQIVLPSGYMDAAFRHVREAGGVCVADEVQVGFGRVGSHFWGFETQAVTPDIVTLGKPMGNGHPIAAVITTPEIASSFNTGMEYFNTYGGNPVSCAIGMAVLDVIEYENLQDNARLVGGHLLDGLAVLADRHEVVGDVRGLGLYIGVEIVDDPHARTPAPAMASRLKERLRHHRILLSTDGPDDNVLKIKPPIVFTRADADRLVDTLGRILEEDEFRS